MQIILTVQACGKIVEDSQAKYRLGISYSDSINLFKTRRKAVLLILNEAIIETKTSCGPPLKKGFDLYHRNIDKWIKVNRFCDYQKGQPTKLVFEFNKTLDDNSISLIFKDKK